MRVMRWLHALTICLAVTSIGPLAHGAEPSGDTLPQVTGLRFGVDGSRTRIVLAIDRRLSFGATVESRSRASCRHAPAPAVATRSPIRWAARAAWPADHRFDADANRLVVTMRQPFRVVDSAAAGTLRGLVGIPAGHRDRAPARR